MYKLFRNEEYDIGKIKIQANSLRQAANLKHYSF